MEFSAVSTMLAVTVALQKSAVESD